MSDLYDDDKIAWAEKQVEMLKNNKLNEVDFKHIIEELEDMGDSSYDKLESFLEVLLTHLLKYSYQKTTLQDTWVENCVVQTWIPSINHPRNRIEKLLKRKPSLEKRSKEALDVAYIDAKQNAVNELNFYIKKDKNKLNDKSFPDICPWKIDKILDKNWLPDI